MTKIITCDAAKTLGLKRYFTGVRCRRCDQTVERRVANRACIACERLKKAVRATRPHNRTKIRDRTRVYTAALYGYAPPPPERDCPPRPADGRCDQCLDPVAGKGRSGFLMDHDHVTGAFRGWVCPGCNHEPCHHPNRAEYLRGDLPWQ